MTYSTASSVLSSRPARPARPCRARNGHDAMLDRLQEVRVALFKRFRPHVGHDRLLHLTLNEAEALAWQTGVPHLVFPTLAEEKLGKLIRWSARQRAIRGEPMVPFRSLARSRSARAGVRELSEERWLQRDGAIIPGARKSSPSRCRGTPAVGTRVISEQRTYQGYQPSA